MSSQHYSTIDPYKFCQIIPNADGSITRECSPPCTVATPYPDDLDHHTLVLSKDVPINQSNNTWVRIFLPRRVLDNSSSPSTKLPLIIHFHGGGFIILCPATSAIHEVCSHIAAEIPCIIVSVEYRLAPEYRLPAAYDDAMEVLQWIKSTGQAEEEWLGKYADFSCCYLMGDSAGGNIAYHVGLRAATQIDNLLPLKIRGLILNHPFFGGVERTESELRSLNDPVLPLCVNDLMWELSLPVGADRDHEYCNPTVGNGGSKIAAMGWRVLVNGGKKDPLIERQIEMMKMMKVKGVKVVSRFGEGGHNPAENPSEYNAFIASIKDFVLSESELE
ncbi:carboxylesterase 1-like [Melia azedarach]|uniref:Carboxylesterase 1-like n=1 Tax=Melia azedarach TaxID=155640 RepID=A0ACC1YJ13_MELAZ|nr:carboxylesterase 1-like [Melia azedarach]